MDKFSLALAISYLDFLKSDEKILLFDTISSAEELTSLNMVDISVIIKRRLKAQFKLESLQALLEKALKLMKFYNIKMLMHNSEEFPFQLKEIPDPPFSLFVRGNLPKGFNMVGIVGTRHPTGEGIKEALRLGAECAQLSLPLVSGLAYGVDCFSQKACVEQKGVSIGVLACGVERIYPKANATLAQKIIGGAGCILSEYPPFTALMKFRFPQRNRIISGLSRSILVVEAPKKSGALITADFALEQGRDVFVCKNILQSKRNEGSRMLYEEGATAISSISELVAERVF